MFSFLNYITYIPSLDIIVRNITIYFELDLTLYYESISKSELNIYISDLSNMIIV